MDDRPRALDARTLYVLMLWASKAMVECKPDATHDARELQAAIVNAKHVLEQVKLSVVNYG